MSLWTFGVYQSARAIEILLDEGSVGKKASKSLRISKISKMSLGIFLRGLEGITLMVTSMSISSEVADSRNLLSPRILSTWCWISVYRKREAQYGPRLFRVVQ